MTEKKLPLSRKYRPKTFSKMFGNEKIINQIENKVKEGIVTTYLLQGYKGTGKTTLARIMANELGAAKQGIKELNISDARGIDAARNIIENIKFSPLSGKCKVIVLNECHGGTKDFWNAMLEVLEEPPKNTYFILCTTEPEKLLNSVKSRCMIFETRSLRKKESIKLIRYVLKKEKIDNFPDDAIKEILKVAEGCPRDILKTLDSVIGIKDDDLLIKSIKNFNVDEASAFELCQALIKKEKWNNISKILRRLDIDKNEEKIRRYILACMANILLKEDNAFIANIIDEFSNNYYDVGKAGLIRDCYLVSQVI